MFFRGKALMIFRNLEPAKTQSREHAIFGNLEPAKTQSHERAAFGNLEPAKLRGRGHAIFRNLESVKSQISEDGQFRNLSEGKFRSLEREDSRTGEKQSQSCRPKKSGFRVWTSGRLVNVWGEKDNLVCVHIRNILRARGCFRNVKVPWSPYK
jgi:hypothetical protein